jgi:outer membrane protein OmpA-like peptidoglycan-associated protein
MTFKTITSGLSIALAGITGCGGAAISPELRTARDTVDEARESPAAMRERSQVRRAERTLALAESASDGSMRERDLAYLADRQARIAMTEANVAVISETFQEDQQRYQQELERSALDHQSEQANTEAQLAQVRSELATVRAELAQRGQSADQNAQLLRERERALALREQQLMAAIAAYADAEQRAQQALAALEELASVRQQNGETIVTISGEVLFEYNQAELRSTARQRLLAVAEALRANPNAEIVIEGHTDAVGSDSFNEQLSQRRADAVRRFLVSEGIEAHRVRAIGRGEDEPIAENETPDGRANNRRVEIHFRPEEARISTREVPAGAPG